MKLKALKRKIVPVVVVSVDDDDPDTIVAPKAQTVRVVPGDDDEADKIVPSLTPDTPVSAGYRIVPVSKLDPDMTYGILSDHINGQGAPLSGPEATYVRYATGKEVSRRWHTFRDYGAQYRFPSSRLPKGYFLIQLPGVPPMYFGAVRAPDVDLPDFDNLAPRPKIRMGRVVVKPKIRMGRVK